MTLTLSVESFRTTLAEAKVDQQRFASEETGWIADNLPQVSRLIDIIFGEKISKTDQDSGYALRAGMLLGNRVIMDSIRDNPVLQREALTNFFGNYELNSLRLSVPEANALESWHEPKQLEQLLGNRQLASALGEVADPRAREGAALILALFSLDQIPVALKI